MIRGLGVLDWVFFQLRIYMGHLHGYFGDLGFGKGNRLIIEGCPLCLFGGEFGSFPKLGVPFWGSQY